MNRNIKSAAGNNNFHTFRKFLSMKILPPNQIFDRKVKKIQKDRAASR